MTAHDASSWHGRTHNCKSLFFSVLSQSDVITAFSLTAAAVSLSVNVLLVVVMAKSKQLKSPANLLVLGLAVSECLVAVVIRPLYTSLLFISVEWINDNCGYIWAVEALATLCMYLVQHFTVALAIDRMLHAGSTRRRPLTRSKALLWVEIVIVLSAMMTGVIVLLTLMLSEQISVVYTATVVVDICVYVIIMAAFTIMALRLRRHVKTSEVYTTSPGTGPAYQRRFFTTVFLMVFFATITHLPYLCFAVYISVRAAASTLPSTVQGVEVATEIVVVLQQTNGTFNAVILLYRNHATKTVLGSCLPFAPCCTERIQPIATPTNVPSTSKSTSRF